MLRVWVIEAPGKKPAFLKALREAGFKNDQVLATFGRLYDLPEGEIGFSLEMLMTPEENTSISWEPKRVSQIKKLVNLLSGASEVVIATDMDLEGELIASQIAHLCFVAGKQSGKDIPFSRVNINSITSSSILSAYSKKTEIDKNGVRAAKARRVLDRVIGYQLHSTEDPWRLSIGRVVSPLISSLRERPAEAVIIRKKLPEGWSAIFRLSSEKAADRDTILPLLHGLPNPIITVGRKETIAVAHKPLTGAEGIKLCLKSLDHDGADISKAIQNNYERGKLSYPRTDSRRLGEVAAKWVQRTAQNHSVEFSADILDDRQSEQVERSYDAHEALLPTTSDLPSANIPLNMMSAEEAVLRVIADYSMRIGEPEQKITREYGTFAKGDPLSAQWTASLGPWLSALEIVRDADEMGMYQDPLLGHVPRAPDLTQGGVDCWNHKIETIIIERLLEIGIGRPSTLMLMSEKAHKHYLDKNGLVNGRGKLMLRKVMQRLPQLLLEENAQPLEEAVCRTDIKISIAQRLAAAWKLLGSPDIEAGSDDLDYLESNQAGKRAIRDREYESKAIDN